jgi:predicted enzyme related to lactoylglutathione lyase
MADRERYDSGTPSWVDLGSPDPSKAGHFYGALFGWDIEDQGPEAGGYCLAKLRGKSVAGLGPQMNPGPSYWTTYVTVDDADKTAQVIGESGGTVVVPPMDVMDAGRMAVAFDQAGAAFSIWQAGNHIGAQIVNEPGTLSWNELTTRDPEGSKAFYGKVFGWGAETHDMGGGMAYTEWKLGDASIGGMLVPDPSMPADLPNFWLVYFAVADCDATCAKTTELGGAVHRPPMDIPQGRFAILGDDQGAGFAVIALSM